MPTQNETTHLAVEIESADPGVDAREKEDALRRLESELSGAGDLEVQQRHSQAPETAKSGMGMLIALGILLAGRRGKHNLVAVVQEWLRHHPELMLKVQAGEFKLELSVATPKDRDELPRKLKRLQELAEAQSEEDADSEEDAEEAEADSDDDSDENSEKDSGEDSSSEKDSDKDSE
jgi:hypothetical protein